MAATTCTAPTAACTTAGTVSSRWTDASAGINERGKLVAACDIKKYSEKLVILHR